MQQQIFGHCENIRRMGRCLLMRNSRALLIASLAAAQVKSDDAGNTRLVKRSTSNSSRDDVAAALTLAIGAFARYPATEAVASGPIVV